MHAPATAPLRLVLPAIVLLLVAALAAPVSATPSFVAGTPVAVGSNTITVAAADVTGDGKPDVVCNRTAGGVFFFPGNGDGTFGSALTYGTGYYSPTSVTLARFDADTLCDLAFTSMMSRAAIAATATGGAGVFGDATVLPAGLDPRYVMAGDFRGDGNTGIAVSNIYSNTVSLWWGHGDGTFGSEIVFGTGTNPNTSVLADFNGDGGPDFAVSCLDPGLVSVVMGYMSEPGYFYPRYDRSAGGPYLTSCAAADLNNDLRPDLVVTTAAGVRVYENYGGGNLQPREEVYAAGTDPRSPCVADFDDDGKLDVAVANLNSGTVSVFPGNGDCTFGARTDYSVGAASYPYQIAASDLDLDGDLDLVVAQNGASQMAVLLNQHVAGVGIPEAPPAGLLPPRPNPARGAVEIGFVLPRAGSASADVYDLQGRRVRALADARPFSAGPATLAWDGADDAGVPVAAGLYLVRVRLAGGEEWSRKLELLR